MKFEWAMQVRPQNKHIYQCRTGLPHCPAFEEKRVWSLLITTDRKKIMKQTCAVTVTYSDRFHLLRQVLDRLLSLPDVAKIVVVDNNSHYNSRSMLHEYASKHPDKICLLQFEKNTGSAGGYGAGIKRALELDCQFIWLLDDDNMPDRDSLDTLLNVYEETLNHNEPDSFALLAFRPEHQADIAMGVSPKRVYPRNGSFWGFHLLDIPFKIWRRTKTGASKLSRTKIQETIPVPWAPYSGFFIHMETARKLGLPDENFVLYGDDTEYTARLTRSGGKIFLATKARLHDLETSWNVKTRFNNSFKGWLLGGNDLRAYYGARNQTYLDYKFWGNFNIWFNLNMNIYFLALLLFALWWRRLDRYRLLKKAVYEGMEEKLGPHKDYLLS